MRNLNNSQLENLNGGECALFPGASGDHDPFGGCFSPCLFSAAMGNDVNHVVFCTL